METGCAKCNWKGYFEYKTGVVSEHIQYIEEVAKEPCECVLEQVSKGEFMKELEKELDEYFDKTSKEQFLKDLESSGCSHMVEEIEVSK